MADLRGRVLFITGASRGIGKAIALRAARDGARIALVAKTVQPHPKLPGTLSSAAQEVESAGGEALTLPVDIRFEDAVAQAAATAADCFGGIDICVNNASAISLTGTLQTPTKRFDLMHQVNTRGTFVTSQACLPYLRQSKNPHILNLAPPLNLDPKWFKDHLAYTLAKYGMSLCVLGMSVEFKDQGIAVNALWPKTAIATAAMDFVAGKGVRRRCRTPEIVADAAHSILTRPSRECTGQFFIDEDVLRAAGVEDFDRYAVEKGAPLLADFFLG